MTETTFFETSVYAHPPNPSVGDDHDHPDETWTEKCGKALCIGALLGGILSFTAQAVKNDTPPGGGRETAEFRETGRVREKLIKPCDCEEEDPPPEDPPGDGSNDGGNDGGNDNDD